MQRMKIDVSKLTDAQKQALAKEMLKIALSRMTPEQRKQYISNMQKIAYKMEVQKKFLKHKKAIGYLTMPIIPITYLYAILKVLTLKKLYMMQALALALRLKQLKEMSTESLNLISPERKSEKKEKQNIQR